MKFILNRFILLSLTLFLFPSFLKGQTSIYLSESEVRQNVLDFMDGQRVMSSSDSRQSRSHIIANPVLRYSSPLLYAYDVSGGFVLAGGIRNIPHILGYSDGGDFASAYKSDCFRALIRQYTQTFSPNFRIFKPSDVSESVAPLCHDSWHQYEPFNLDCPYINNYRCVVGCVATSMSELLNFYKYPDHGTGYIEYEDTAGCKQTLSTDLDSHSYQWEQILDDYNGDYTDTQGKAVAQLCYDCGVLVNMRYGVSSSGAQVISQPLALVNHLGYDESMQMLYRNFYSQVEWDSIMFHELDAGRPILVGGWGQDGGHSYICDGYDSNGLFHIRMGYPDNSATGYYYFTWTTPDLPEWLDVDSPEKGFNVLQSILIGAVPKKSPLLTSQHWLYAFSHISPLCGQSTTFSLNDEFQIGVYNLCNIGWNHHHDRVGLALKKISSERVTRNLDTVLLYQYDHEFSLEELTDSTYSDTLILKLPYDLVSGRYKIVPVYEEGNTFIEARTTVGTPNYLECTVNGDVVVLNEPESEKSDLELSDVEFPDVIYRDDHPKFSYTVTNKGAEYSGRIYTCLYHDKIPTMNNVLSIQGVSIGSGEIQHYDFVRTSGSYIPAGTLYHLRIMCDIDLLSDSCIVLLDDSLNYYRVYESLTGVCGVVKAMPSEPTYYDLSGRRIVSLAGLRRGSIYIEVLPEGEVRKRIF